ncbi:MAG: sigma-70 family RNA polymerase sigma factor [Gammaproteobacteria bacterium]
MSDLNPSGSRTLEELIMAIANDRDREAFIRLFELASPRLKAYAMRCGAGGGEAEEIVQECLFTVWRKAHTFNPAGASANTWLYTIIRNKRIDFARKNQKTPISAEDLWPAESSEGPEKQVESDLNAKVVRTLLEGLPREQRQVIYKVYFEGKSHSEIAKELGLPLGTVKSQLRLAMSKLNSLAKETLTWFIIILLTNI